MNRQKITVESTNVHLKPHRQDVGDLGSLAHHLATSDGDLLPPAIVRDRKRGDYLVVGGERRWLATQALPALPTYAIVCDVWADFLAWMALDKMREHPGHRSMPYAVTDAVLLTETVAQYLSPGRDDHMDHTVAEYLDVLVSRLGEARSIKRIMDRNNPEDIQALVEWEWRMVTIGEASPSAAFQRIRKAQIRRDAPPANAAEQRTKLTRAAGICAGLVDGLANFGEVSPELSTREREEAIEKLSAGRRTLETVIRRLGSAS